MSYFIIYDFNTLIMKYIPKVFRKFGNLYRMLDRSASYYIAETYFDKEGKRDKPYYECGRISYWGSMPRDEQHDKRYENISTRKNFGIREIERGFDSKELAFKHFNEWVEKDEATRKFEFWDPNEEVKNLEESGWPDIPEYRLVSEVKFLNWLYKRNNRNFGYGENCFSVLSKECKGFLNAKLVEKL